MPDSTLRLDLAELQDSRISGINDSTITAQMLPSNVSNVEVKLVADLQTSISFGITIGIINIAAGPFIKLPRFNMSVSQFTTNKVGANCEPDGDTVDEFKDTYQNLTHVEYNVGIAAGLKAGAGFLYNKQIVLAEKGVSLATQCLVWQSEGTATQFAPATEVLAVMTSPLSLSETGGGERKKSAGVALTTPLSGILIASGISCMGILLLVCAIGSLTLSL